MREELDLGLDLAYPKSMNVTSKLWIFVFHSVEQTKAHCEKLVDLNSIRGDHIIMMVQAQSPPLCVILDKQNPTAYLDIYD